MQSIYLDHNATTPTRPEVVEAMGRCYAEKYANPASQHRPGQQARRVLEDARERIAEILDADLGSSPPRPAHLHQRRHRGQQPGHIGHRPGRR